MPTELTIAGSDPTGGAGIQADLQTFSSLGLHGAAVITAITIQDTHGVQATHPLPGGWVREQLACLLSDIDVGAAKTGMLGSAEVVEAVAGVLSEYDEVPLVVDPVLRSSSGAALLEDAGVEALIRVLVPRAALVTPNLAEAQVLTGRAADTVEDMKQCAQAIVDLGAGAVLVKGGHLPGASVDVLCAEGELVELPGERVRSEAGVHGTGCALSAAATAFLAQSDNLRRAVEKAKVYVTAGIRHARSVGGGSPVIDYRAAAASVNA